jgi:hypothetical protein
MNEHSANGMNDSPDGQDPTEESAVAGDSPDAAEEPDWRGTGEEFDFLRNSFRSSYKEGAAEGPSQEEVMGALRTLAGAISHMVAGAGNTLKDPSVKQQVKKTTRSAFAALAGVLSDWAAELRSKVEGQRGDQSDPEAEQSTGPAESEAGEAPSDQEPQQS